MKKKSLALISAVLVLTMLLSACGGTSNSPSPSPSATAPEATEPAGTETPDAGAQEIIFALQNQPDNIDPSITNNSFAWAALINCFEGLVTYDTTDGSLTAGNAKDWTISDDGLVYTFNLREGLKWSDGTPLTAEDYVYTFQRVLTPETTANYFGLLADYVLNAQEFYDGEATAEELGVKALDENTLELTLKAPTPFYIDILTMWTFAPVQKATVEENGDSWTLNADSYVSNGPFMMSDMKLGESFTIVKNPNYWDAENVKLDQITFRYIADPATALSAFETGEIDGSFTVPPADSARLRMGGTGVISVQSYATVFYSINNQKAPYDNPLVRKAFNLAIDRNALINDVVQLSGAPAYSAVAPGYTVDGDEFASTRSTFGLSPTADVEAAREALSEAGYPDGEGFPTLTLSYYTNENAKKIAEAMAEMLKENLNIEVELFNEDWAIYKEERLLKGDFDIAHTGWGADYLHPMTFLALLKADDMNNYAKYSNAEYDDLIAQAKVETDPVAALELMRQADNLASGEYPLIPLYYRQNEMLLNDNVQGFYYSPSNHLFFRNAFIAE